VISLRRRAAVIGRIALVLVAVPVGVASLDVALADFTIRDWRYVKEVQLPNDLAGEGLAAIAPDVEVFGQAAPGLVDLRVVENGETEVPFQIVVERGMHQQGLLPARIRDLGVVPEEHTSFVVETNQPGALHNEVEVLTPSRNFQRTVQVEGSDDAENWAVLRQGGRIFDFTLRDPSFTTRNTRISYPDSTARYLRVRILDQQEQPLTITGASVSSVQDRPDRESLYSADIIGRSEEEQPRASVLNLDLKVNGLPTSRVRVNTGQVNFYRRVLLEASGDSQTWETISTSGELFSYDTPKFVGSQLTVTYPETTRRYLRLTIYNQDNPPLEIVGLEVYGVSRRLLFPARPGASYRLYYGNADARAPSYDLARFLPYLETEGLPLGDLGAQADNPAYMIPQEPWSERLPWLIPAVVALAAVIVGMLLLGVLRQAKSVLPPPH
jgi:hypothetical protein